ncbi:Ig-like domain-containing protein [Patescibacteria group bacterium]|nr:Ig-like domain-containing protein [Patescibacteria group bacterium]MBU1683313.1 Ig-like domain-containing protein [Patescibacteria group bacterium]
MASPLKIIGEMWHLRKVRAAIIIVAFLGLFISGYNAISSPYIEGADSADAAYKVSFNAPFTLHFNQRMNKKSVEEAFQIYPKLSGDFVWPDGKTLEYHPSGSLSIDDDYRIVIGAEANSFFQKSLGVDVTLNFTVTGPPYVQFVAPGPILDSVDVPVVAQDQIITVMFDRPIEWPDVNIHEGALLQISPPVKGEYRILGLSTFQFIPDELPMNTHFILTVPAGVPARDGGKTEEDKTWEMETPALRVLDSSPQVMEENVGINTSITLYFNQPVDLEKIKPSNNALLYPSNDLDAGANPQYDGFFNTEVTYGKNDEGKTDKTILVFEPTFPYLYDMEYKFVLKSGLPAEKGNLGSKKDFELYFKTSSEPGIENIEPPTVDQQNIVITFNTPMTAESILENLSISPEVGIPAVMMTNNNYKVEINYNLQPDTEYIFELKDALKDAAGNELKSGEIITFTTSALESEFYWESGSNLGTFMQGVDPEFIVKHQNISELNLELCQVTERNFFNANENNSWEGYNCYDQPLSLRVQDAGSTLLNVAALFKRDLGNGIYYLSVEADDLKIYKVFFVTDTTLVLKKSGNSMLVWATDSMSGEPVSRMELFVYGYDGEELSRGVTDGDGVYKITRDLGEGVYVTGKKNIDGENRWALISEYWLTGTDYPSSSEWFNSGQQRVYLMSDRNTLHAGEDFNVQGIFRTDYDAMLTIPEAEKQVIFKLEDDDQNVLIDETIFLRRNGSFDAVLSLPSNISSGTYQLKVYNQSGELIPANNKYIVVAEEDLPFEMNWINPTYDYYTDDIILFDLEAFYDLGIPAASLRGQWKLYKKPYYYSNHIEGAFYSFGDLPHLLCSKGACNSNENLVNEGEFRFDQNGLAQIVLTDNEGSSLEEGYEYRLVAAAQNIDGREISKTLSFKVYPGKFYIGLSAKHYLLNPTDDINVSIITSDIQNNFIDGEEVELALVQMSGDKEKKIWYSKVVDVSTQPTVISIPITSKMPSGVYKLRAEGSDDEGNEVFAELECYVIDDEENQVADSLTLLFDQPEYFVGGKAHLKINAPYATSENPMTALIAYQRGEIIGYQVVTLESTLTSVDIPIADAMVPNIYVTAMVIKQNEDIDSFLEGQELRRAETEYIKTELEILLLEEELQSLLNQGDGNEDEISRLQEEIESLKNQIPEDLEISGNADLNSIDPTIEEISANILVSNPDQEINVNITVSPQEPQPGEDVTINFYSYDYQNRPIASVVTLNIFDNQYEENYLDPLPLDFFYKPRNSQISTSSNATLPKSYLIDGNTSSSFSSSPALLNEIQSSAYFNPVVLTDESGNGEVTFTLPDKNITWQVDAVVTSDAKKFGYSRSDIAVKKRLEIKPITPAFVIPGDQIVIGAQIQNLSNEKVETSIELLVDDIELSGNNKKNISIESGEVITVDWNVEIGPFAEDEMLKIALRSSGDYVETKVPIKYPQIFETLGGMGQVEDEWNGKMRILQEIIENKGGLNVSISAIPINIIEKYIDEIQGYSFSSVELLASNLIAEASDAKIQELLSKQRADGGYAFWDGSDESSPWLTAYVLFALNFADAGPQQASIQYLWDELSDENLPIADRLFILWVLSEVGQYNTSATLEAFQNRDQSSLSGIGFLLMNIDNLVNAGQKSAFPYLERLQGELVSEKIIEDDSFIYFEDEKGNGLDTNIRSTAIVLLALTRLSGENLLIPPMVNYLISLTSDRYNSQEAVWKILALSEFIDRGILNPNFITQVDINGETVIDTSVTSDNFKEIYSYNLSLNALKENEINEVNISKDGAGNLYYIAELTYYLPNEKILPAEEGASIIRTFYSAEDGSKVTEMNAGNLYYGKLHLIVPEDMSYVVVEDNLPAGIKALAFSPELTDESRQYQIEDLADRYGFTWINNPLWYFDENVIEDDRLLLYAEYLPAGVYEIDYLLQAGIPGKYNHLPASIRQMYNPEVYGRTGGGWMEIR